MSLSRRDLLTSTGLALLLSVRPAAAKTIAGGLPWTPDPGAPPAPVKPGSWEFFTPEEGAAVEALVDRIIPPDPEWPGAKEAGVAVFIDRQLAGPYGSSRALYMRPPFHEGPPTQGPQSPLTPAQRYRNTLAALDKHCRSAFANRTFAQLSDEQKDKIIGEMEKGPLKLEGVSATGFMEQLVRNTQEGFFADPVYGGNRNMVGWRMIGFPGARYDLSEWVDKHNQKCNLPPVGITGRPEWNRT
jgi:gluconate 2-dehydrogenase gamma chain